MLPDAEEDLVSGCEAGEVSYSVRNLGEDRHGVGELALREMREVDVNDFVAGRLKVGEGGVAGGKDGGFGEIEVGSVNPDDFVRGLSNCVRGWVGKIH